MNWEETILHARNTEEYKQLIEQAYLDADLARNVENFIRSDEFLETLNLIGKYFQREEASGKIKILDIGAGNGISSIAFALKGFSVVSVEPDPSNTVGFGAINFLKNEYGLTDLFIDSSYGESLAFNDESFDIVYARQAMHHAQDLDLFVSEAARVLKKNGLFITCRDHVANDAKQKEIFLKTHPLQKFYHGENAFSIDEYQQAFFNAKLNVIAQFGHLDSVINYNPQTKNSIVNEFREVLENKLHFKIPNQTHLNKFIFWLFKWKTNNLHNFAGRLYSFIAQKS